MYQIKFLEAFGLCNNLPRNYQHWWKVDCVHAKKTSQIEEKLKIKWDNCVQTDVMLMLMQIFFSSSLFLLHGDSSVIFTVLEEKHLGEHFFGRASWKRLIKVCFEPWKERECCKQNFSCGFLFVTPSQLLRKEDVVAKTSEDSTVYFSPKRDFTPNMVWAQKFKSDQNIQNRNVHPFERNGK